MSGMARRNVEKLFTGERLFMFGLRKKEKIERDGKLSSVNSLPRLCMRGLVMNRLALMGHKCYG